MAGSSGVRLALAAAEAGALASLPCAMLGPDQIRAQVAEFRAKSRAPLNLNFFVHAPPAPDAAREAAWRELWRPFYEEFGVAAESAAGPNRAPFDEAACAVVEDVKPEIVSFHFGLPSEALTARVRAAGAKILSSATSVAEAQFLEARGCDAIIAQGVEAGGHQGVFLRDDIAAQIGTFALTPLIADAVKVPLIAAGGIADARGAAAAFRLGASAVQIGTAYLKSPECDTSPIHRAALDAGGDTALTNVFTGRPARGIINRAMRAHGPMSALAPAFPVAAAALAPLRRAAEAKGAGDFSPLWAGAAHALAKPAPAAVWTRALMEETARLLAGGD